MTHETAVGHIDPSSQELNKLTKSPLRKVLSALTTVVLIIGVLISGAFAYVNYTYTPLYVDGRSMQPTLNGTYEGYVELGYMETSARVLNKLKRKDIVVYQKNNGSNDGIIKRVIGFPGETLLFKKGNEHSEGLNTFYINEIHVKQVDATEFTLLEEPYLSASNVSKTYTWDGTSFEVTLGASEYYLLGDNRGASQDSRYVGPIPFTQLLGRLKVIYGHATKVCDENANNCELIDRVVYEPWKWRVY